MARLALICAFISLLTFSRYSLSAASLCVPETTEKRRRQLKWFPGSSFDIVKCYLQEDRVQIQGLLRIQNSADCSSGEMSTFSLNLGLAMEYVLSQINNTDLAVPGIQYDLSVEDICNNRSLAVRTASVSLPRSLWTEQKFCSSSEEEDNSPLLLGYLGAAYSSSAKPIGEFLSSLKVPLITPSATLGELSDRNKYNSLLRTTVSDDIQSKALVEFAMSRGWSYVLLMHSDDDYGTQGAATVKEVGLKKGICFSQTISVKTSDDDVDYYRKVAAEMIQDGANGIIFFGHYNEAYIIISSYLKLVRQFHPTKFILAADGVSESPDILEIFKVVSNELRLAVVSSYYQEELLTPFQDYKAHRVQQQSTYGDPMDEVLEKFKSHCSSQERTFQSSQDCINKLLETTDSTQSMLEATIALLSAFKLTHSQLCSSESGVCEVLNDSQRFYDVMLSHLYSNRVNAIIEGQNFSVGFDASMGSINSSAPLYRLSIVNANKYEQAGYYYVHEGWNNISSLKQMFNESRCKTNCSACQPERPPYQYARRSSPYIIVGTTPISEQLDTHTCSKSINAAGFVRMEAFFYAVEYINKLTGIEFSTLFIDTCYAEINTHMILNDIFNGATYADLITVDNKREQVDVNKIAVVIGDLASSISLTLQTYLRLYQIPQISYASTSSWLDDRTRYPKFLRTVPSDSKQAQLIVELILKLGVTEVGLIYQTDSAYALNGGELVIKYVKEKSICLTYVKTLTRSTYDDVARDLRKTALNSLLPKMIIIFLDPYALNPLLKKIKNYNDPSWTERGHVFIASESWGVHKDIIEGVESLVYGSLVFSLSGKFTSWTVDGVNYFEDYLIQQTPENNKNNLLFKQFWQEQFNCYLPDSYSSQSNVRCDLTCKITDSSCAERRPQQSLDYQEDILSKHIIMAGMSVAYAIKEAIAIEDISCTSSNCAELFETQYGRERFFSLLKKVQIPTDVKSKHRSYKPFSDDGNGKANYIISNIVKDSAKVYKSVYSVEEGKFFALSNPLFYQGGEPVGLSSERCSSCICKLGTGKSDKLNGNKTVTENLISASPEPLLIGILVVSLVLLLLIIIIIFVACHNRQSMYSSTKQLPSMGSTASSIQQSGADSCMPIQNLRAPDFQNTSTISGNCSAQSEPTIQLGNTPGSNQDRRLPCLPEADDYLNPSLPQSEYAQMTPLKTVGSPQLVCSDNNLSLPALENSRDEVVIARSSTQPPPAIQPIATTGRSVYYNNASPIAYRDLRMADAASANGVALSGPTSNSLHGHTEPHMMIAKSLPDADTQLYLSIC